MVTHFLKCNLTINFINPEIKPRYYSNISRDNVHWADTYLSINEGGGKFKYYPYSAIAWTEEEVID